MQPRDLPANAHILVIMLRRLGDMLLTTPLVRTLRCGFPDARVDMLAFAGSQRILAGNPDIDAVVTTREGATVGESLSLLRRLWRSYDLVISTQAGDRPTFFAWASGRRRIGLVMAHDSGYWWKRLVHDHPVLAEADQHRVTELLRLSGALGLTACPDLVPPSATTAASIAPTQRYAVIHVNPFYRYKRWTDEGWRGLARSLADRGLAVVATEGRDAAEQRYAEKVWGSAEPRVVRERGRLDFGGLAALLRDAAVYIGPDTSITHLATACGCPTVALYGPTSPRLIGPWPGGVGLTHPWDHAGAIQRRAHVWVVQNPLPCLPCERLGCAGHLDSHSRCLDELGVAQVMRAVDAALADARVRSATAAAAGAFW